MMHIKLKQVRSKILFTIFYHICLFRIGNHDYGSVCECENLKHFEDGLSFLEYDESLVSGNAMRNFLSLALWGESSHHGLYSRPALPNGFTTQVC